MFLDLTYISFGVQLDQVFLPLETEFPDLGPGEGVDLGVVLEDQDPALSHGQVQGHTFVVLYKRKEENMLTLKFQTLTALDL